MPHSEAKNIQLTSPSYFTYSQGKYFHVHGSGHDPVCDWIINSKCMYEHYVLMMISPILRECSYLVDIGCHVGTYTYAKWLTGNLTRTLSIDASQENIDIAKMNNANLGKFDSIHGFWVDEETSHSHTLLSNEFKGKGHDKLHSSITHNPENSFKIPNIRTSAIIDWINDDQHLKSPEAKPGFIKIDIDGSEVNTSEELCTSLIHTKSPFIMLIETGSPKVIEALVELGIQVLALLPGNNFLVCNQETFSETKHAFCLHQTLALTASYLNKMAKDADFLRRNGARRDGKSITFQTPFGEFTSESSIINNHWEEHLAKHNIPMLCYG